MPDADLWRKKAAELRESAKASDDAENGRVLLVLAEDCDEIAGNLDRDNQEERPEK